MEKTYYYVEYTIPKIKSKFPKLTWFDDYEKVLAFAKICKVNKIVRHTFSCREVIENIDRIVSENQYN